MPRGFEKLLHREPELSPLITPPRNFTQRKYHLHVRQQPAAARACGASVRDRRPVDPPPIVQILLSDFDPQSTVDQETLQDPRLTVSSLLFPMLSTNPSQSPELETRRHPDPERKSKDIAHADNSFAPLLSGNMFMSPFCVDADPDPNSAPTHPSSRDSNLGNHTFPGPGNLRNATNLRQPATFFIFADLSIRSAGLYRLKFRLMNWGSVEDTGQSMPILAEVWSDPFRVYPARRFPGMRDSSILANSLKELGFADLKNRGFGKGKGRKK
ncbi:Velvet factor [Penicillium italicum]|uniref:Velvet factor n=1 Tax=Penicillium italicum TaxID=40296 RepID=A0A0A2L6S8_PENIT|nr:Velvet factor [Penicillium italicum]